MSKITIWAVIEFDIDDADFDPTLSEQDNIYEAASAKACQIGILDEFLEHRRPPPPADAGSGGEG